MEVLKESQRRGRILLTKQSQAMDRALLDNVTLEEFEDIVTVYRQRRTALEDIHKQIQNSEKEDQIEATITEQDNFINERNKSMYKVDKKIKDLKKESVTLNHIDNDDNEIVMVQNDKNIGVRLPIKSLLKFNGHLPSWKPWKEMYEINIHNRNMPAVTKFTYLFDLLEGEAKDVIKGFPMTANDYNDAWDLLCQRFGREAQIKLSHFSDLLKLERPKASKGMEQVKSLYSLLNKIQTHVRQLKNLGVTGESYEAFLCPFIISRFPESVSLEWSRDCEGKESDLQFTLDFLLKEIRRLERSSGIRVTMENVEPVQFQKSKNNATATALTTVTEDSSHMPDKKYNGGNKKIGCAFCKVSNHKTVKCNKFKTSGVQGRLALARKEKLCFKCLEKHMSHNCKHRCLHCSGEHHETLCYAKERSTQQPNTGNNYGFQYNNSAPPGQVSLHTNSQPLANNFAHEAQNLNFGYTPQEQGQSQTSTPGFDYVRGVSNSGANSR